VIVNGAIFLFILGVWVSYKLACWAHDAAEARAANHEIRGRQS